MNILKTVKKLVFESFTIIIIPKTSKKTKQIKLNSFSTYIVILCFIAINIFISITSIAYYNKTKELYSENNNLNVSLESKANNISQLNSEIQTQKLNINTLTTKNEDEITYLSTSIKEINELKAQLAKTISAFNIDNNLSISIPISRSLDSSSISTIYKSKNYDDINAAPDLDELKKQDELITLINDLKLESSELTNEIEKQLNYLDCLPDNIPVKGVLSSGFGYRIHPISKLRSFHNGIDISASRGTPVHAAGSGIVVFSGYSGSFGKVVIISHGYGYETVYAHNREIHVKVNDVVKKGDIISEVGTTGVSTGPHLHFEIHVDNELIDPKSILKFN